MENFQLNKKVKVFLFLVVTIPFLVLFGIVMGDDIINPKSRGEIFLNLRIEIECEGIVNSIYREKMNHNVQTLKTDNCIFQVDANWEDRFLIGDSISKKEGEVIVEHYRDGELLEVLDYRDLAKNRKNIKDSFFPLWKKNK